MVGTGQARLIASTNDYGVQALAVWGSGSSTSARVKARSRGVAANGCHVVGVDISRPSLIQAKQQDPPTRNTTAGSIRDARHAASGPYLRNCMSSRLMKSLSA